LGSRELNADRFEFTPLAGAPCARAAKKSLYFPQNQGME
jgi:hypothetical protein